MEQKFKLLEDWQMYLNKTIVQAQIAESWEISFFVDEFEIIRAACLCDRRSWLSDMFESVVNYFEVEHSQHKVWFDATFNFFAERKVNLSAVEVFFLCFKVYFWKRSLINLVDEEMNYVWLDTYCKVGMTHYSLNFVLANLHYFKAVLMRAK